jgi:hypothetical protein
MKNHLFTPIHSLMVVRDPGVALPATHVAPAEPSAASSAALGLTREQHEEAVNKARSQERAKLNATLENERQKAADLQRRLDEQAAEARKRELAAMEPVQRLQAELEDQRQMFARVAAESSAAVESTRAEVRAWRLAAHREALLRAYGNEIFPILIVGNTEDELTASAEQSHRQFMQMQQASMAAAAAHFQALMPQPTQQPLPQAPAYPAAPAVVVPANTAYAAPVPFPTMASPGLNMPAAGAAPQFDPSLFGEAAIRNGSYSQNRDAILNALKANHPGAIPQQHHISPPSPMPYTQAPGGVLAPTGLPGRVPQSPVPQQPASNQFLEAMPRGVQPPQAPVAYAPQEAPVAPPVAIDPALSGAQAAIARLEAGSTVDPQAIDAMNQRNATIRKMGVTPAQAFMERFATN